MAAVMIAVCGLAPRCVVAKPCGDDVAGQDVPCACGDTVVSDVVLADDPVTTAACAGDGLVVRANGSGHAVTIDLAGKTLRGTGQGTGIWIVDGGPGGARLISSGSRALIDGFRDGVVGGGRDSVAHIESLRVSDSRRDGMRINTVGYSIRAAEVADSGRDGFSLRGRSFHITATVAQNSKRFGYAIGGTYGEIGAPGAGNRTVGSGHAGFSVSGTGHRLVQCAASAAHGEGFHLSGMHYAIIDCTADGNGGDGFTGTGMTWQLRGNQATNNGGNGLALRGLLVTDSGGNRGSGNGTPRLLHPSIQCQINNAPCVP